MACDLGEMMMMLKHDCSVVSLAAGVIYQTIDRLRNCPVQSADVMQTQATMTAPSRQFGTPESQDRVFLVSIRVCGRETLQVPTWPSRRGEELGLCFVGGFLGFKFLNPDETNTKTIADKGIKLLENGRKQVESYQSASASARSTCVSSSVLALDLNWYVRDRFGGSSPIPPYSDSKKPSGGRLRGVLMGCDAEVGKKGLGSGVVNRVPEYVTWKGCGSGVGVVK